MPISEAASVEEFDNDVECVDEGAALRPGRFSILDPQLCRKLFDEDPAVLKGLLQVLHRACFLSVQLQCSMLTPRLHAAKC